MPQVTAFPAASTPLVGDEITPLIQGGTDSKATVDDLSAAAVAYDPLLSSIAGLTFGADNYIYGTGSDTAAVGTITSFARTLLDDAAAGNVLTTLGVTANGQSLVTAANYAAMRGLLDLEAGTDFNAYSARLADIAGITYAQGDVFYYDGANIVKLAAGTSGHFLKTQGVGANPVWAAAAGSVADFTDLGDVPASYTGEGGKVVAVNGTEDGLEFISAAGGLSAASTTEQLTGTEAGKASTPDSVAALWEQGGDVASAGTISLGEGGYFFITGTTTITDIDFATDKAGRKAWVKFAGALTLTHNASTLILPTGASITTAAGDTACFVSEGSDAVRCVAYQRADGTALSGASANLTENLQTGNSYTIQASDNGKLIVFTGTDVAVTLGTAASMGAGFNFRFFFLGTGYISINVTTSLINGRSTYVGQNGSGGLVSGNGSAYRCVANEMVSGGSRGVSRNVPDSTSVGGDVRGNYAFDGQTTRASSDQVASGLSATTFGDGNKASGNQSVAMGYRTQATATGAVSLGISTQATSQAAVAIGQSVIGSNSYSASFGFNYTNAGYGSIAAGAEHASIGDYSQNFGYKTSGVGNAAQYTYGAAATPGSAGSAQARKNLFFVKTTGSSAVRLTADGGAASATNVGALNNNSAIGFTVVIIIRDETAGNSQVFTFGPCLIVRGANAAATAVSAGNPAVTAGPQSTGTFTLAANPTIAADTTRGGVNISYTPPAGNTNTFTAVAYIDGVETRT